MNIGLIIGKKNSVGVPGKNTKSLLGRPSAEYAFIASEKSNIDMTFCSTDCPTIKDIAKKYQSIIIDRPNILATPESLTEDVLTHAYEEIIKKVDEKKIDTISLLFCNNPAIDVNLLNEAIDFLKASDDFDSCFSVANYDMFSPQRARKLDETTQEILPFIDLNLLGDFSSIRGSQGSVYFCDLSIQVMKKRCFTNMSDGNLPFKWQGKKSKAMITDFGFDVDSIWQQKVIEYWLENRGFTKDNIPW